ncbi:MAG: hypothetical protein CL993_00045 [Euryarchaeota archaeon]|nr:hypothetical protein [Euryarchaeota archaeon]
MGASNMIASNQNRRIRQPAIRIFAQEYSEASLIEEGQGEYDPSFVVTKLGARVNRVMVSGVIDRLQRSESENGPSYSGQIRDPTGSHSFNVAPFQPELHADVEELLVRYESGDRFLMTIVGRARWFESEEGGIFTSLRVEELALTSQEIYKLWLVDTADSTLRRINSYTKSQDCEMELSSYLEFGIPEDLALGIISSRRHYSIFDTEIYRVGVLQAISLATERGSSIDFQSEEVESSNEDQEDSVNIEDLQPRTVILQFLGLKKEDFVDYDSIVSECSRQGISREDAEDAIEYLREVSEEIIEPKFGFYKLI